MDNKVTPRQQQEMDQNDVKARQQQTERNRVAGISKAAELERTISDQRTQDIHGAEKLKGLKAWLAANPDVQQLTDERQVNNEKQLRALQTNYDYLMRMQLDDAKVNATNSAWKPDKQVTQAIAGIRQQMASIIVNAGQPTPKKAPGTVTIGEGDNSITLSTDRINRMIADPNVMQQELSQMPPEARGQVMSQLGVNEVNNTLNPQQQASQTPGAQPVTPVPSQQLGGEDALKSTVKNFLMSGMTGAASDVPESAQNQVSQVSGAAKSATKKGIV